jgi:hypothetical protein
MLFFQLVLAILIVVLLVVVIVLKYINSFVVIDLVKNMWRIILFMLTLIVYNQDHNNIKNISDFGKQVNNVHIYVIFIAVIIDLMVGFANELLHKFGPFAKKTNQFILGAYLVFMYISIIGYIMLELNMDIFVRILIGFIIVFIVVLVLKMLVLFGLYKSSITYYKHNVLREYSVLELQGILLKFVIGFTISQFFIQRTRSKIANK